MPDLNQWIESEQEVQNYIDKLRYALSCGVKITFQRERLVDQERDERYTNHLRYPICSRMKTQWMH